MLVARPAFNGLGKFAPRDHVLHLPVAAAHAEAQCSQQRPPEHPGAWEVLISLFLEGLFQSGIFFLFDGPGGAMGIGFFFGVGTYFPRVSAKTKLVFFFVFFGVFVVWGGRFCAFWCFCFVFRALARIFFWLFSRGAVSKTGNSRSGLFWLASFWLVLACFWLISFIGGGLGAHLDVRRGALLAALQKPSLGMELT